MYERFTDRARSVMQLANLEAQRFNHEYIGTEHMLLGLIKEGSGVAANVLKNLDIDLRKVRLEVEKIVQTGPGGDQVVLGKLPHTPRAKKVIEYSVEEARRLNHNYVGTEHLLLGLLREQEGVAAQVLMNLGLKLEDVREEVLNLLGHNTPGSREAASSRPSRTPSVNRYSTDLTDLARRGKLDRCIGRQEELSYVSEILTCRLRPNPLIIGEPGVGKSTLVARLAQSIAVGYLPDWFRNRRIMLLPFSRLWSREDRSSGDADLARAVFREVRHAKDSILFLPDAVSSLGLRAGGVVADRVGAELLLALSTDEIPTILTATPTAYQRCLRRYPSLELLIQPVVLRPLSVDETVSVLNGIRERFETHHGVRFANGAIEALAEVAARELPGSLPGKAVQLLDRTAARVSSRAWRPLAESGAAIAQLDTQIEEANRKKEEAVGKQEFDRALEFRNRVDELRAEKERLVQEAREPGQLPDTVVDAAVVAEVVRDMVAQPSPPATEGQ
jgi:ATP-dependent Clp protease ATP-binding subunit ClpC